MAERHEKAPPYRFRRQPVHVMATFVNGELALHKWWNSARQKIEQESSNQNKARQVKSKKSRTLLKAFAHQYVERSPRRNAARHDKERIDRNPSRQRPSDLR